MRPACSRASSVQAGLSYAPRAGFFWAKTMVVVPPTKVASTGGCIAPISRL